MARHQDFLRAVLADPDDDGPRLIYGDWLDERGQAERAEFIRVQCALARLPEGSLEAAPLRAREADLLPRHRSVWEARVPAPEGITWGEFERGFMCSITARDEDTFHRHAPRLYASIPLTRLKLERVGLGGTFELSSSPFDFRDVWEGVDRLGTSPHLTRIRALDLSRCVIGPVGASALVRSCHLGSVTDLNLSNSGLGAGGVGVDALAGSLLLGRLTRLDLGYNSIRDEGVRALVRSPRLRNLEYLDLTYNRITQAGARSLIDCPHLEGLRQLDLTHNQFDQETREELRGRFGDRVRCPHLFETLGDLLQISEEMDIRLGEGPAL